MLLDEDVGDEIMEHFTLMRWVEQNSGKRKCQK